MNEDQDKDEAEEMMEIIFDPEFDEWAGTGLIPNTGEIPSIGGDRDTEDLPAVKP